MTIDDKLTAIEQRDYKLNCDETGWFFTALDAEPPFMMSFYSDNREHAVDAMTTWLAGIDAMMGQS